MITFLEFITESEFRSKLIPALRNLDVPVDHKKHILKGKRGWTHQETAEHHGIGPDNRIKGELGYWHTGKHKFYPKHNSDFDGEEGLNIDSTELDPRAGSVALMRRLEEGNPLSQDLKHRRKGIHKIIISAARKNLPDKKNKKRMKTLYKRLKASGAVFKKTKGVWQNAAGEIENEKSVMAHLPNDPTGEKIVSLGHKLRRKYNQDTFIHRTPEGKGIAHNRDGSADVYGNRTASNVDNPYGETRFKPTKPADKQPKITFTDEPEPKSRRGSFKKLK